MFTVRNGPRSWEYRSRGMVLITHPSLLVILRISRAIPLLLLCAINGMLWSDLYLLHMCGWLFVKSVFMYRHKRKATKNKRLKSKEFTKKVCFFLSTNSYWEIAKRAQFNILFQNITFIFFSHKITKFPVYLFESSTFWYPQWKEWYLVQDKMFLETAAL